MSYEILFAHTLKHKLRAFISDLPEMLSVNQGVYPTCRGVARACRGVARACRGVARAEAVAVSSSLIYGGALVFRITEPGRGGVFRTAAGIGEVPGVVETGIRRQADRWIASGPVVHRLLASAYKTVALVN